MGGGGWLTALILSTVKLSEINQGDSRFYLVSDV